MTDEELSRAKDAVLRARRDLPLFRMLEDVISDLFDRGHVPQSDDYDADLRAAYELAKQRTLN
ncbi:hypothetical protein W911_14630 [Hyphomicrobium nitrativorans NL23]|uniref:Uncharacterized protein n=1 Tax=Hyphomicrobium nitrativorans NL23 TaxID=1029756 RepID=V5SIJ4_9HYPH|nr:hypothetical protein [Hyphomicrobium nitrativorans]AHB50348.1 hypothetical protein W911_14630 [Hyphomicrobium nitrativorans NL23]